MALVMKAGRSFAAGLLLIVAACFFTAISRTLLFWSAFILTRPLGGDPGGFPGQANQGRRTGLQPLLRLGVAGGVHGRVCFAVLAEKSRRASGRNTAGRISTKDGDSIVVSHFKAGTELKHPPQNDRRVEERRSFSLQPRGRLRLVAALPDGSRRTGTRCAARSRQ